ncbi:iron donor protein CyaY [Rickettsiales bacterium]|nr:iron donor protein CyaY [Rickettsiales bacterium]
MTDCLYMDETDFEIFAEKILLKIADHIEDNDEDSIFEVDYLDGILDIKIFATGQKYIINKHRASQKIWFSSPNIGAKYFSYDANLKKWIDNEDELWQYFFDELKKFYKF